MVKFLVNSFLQAVACCWLLTASATASPQTSHRSQPEPARLTGSQQFHLYRMMPISDLTAALNAQIDSLISRAPTLIAHSKTETVAVPVRPSSRIQNAAFEVSDNGSTPVLLVDCAEASGLGDSSRCSPVFESTLSSRPDSLKAEMQGSDAFFTNGRGSQRLRRDRCDGNCEHDCDVCNPCSPWYKVFRTFCSPPTFDEGIGRERVMFAPFDIEVPLPNNHFAMRFDAANGLRTPDRAEYFWASQTGPGPDAGERSIDYNDLRFVLSAGGKRFSTITEVPLRFVDASGNGGTGGLSNVSIATKLLLIDGQNWKVTQYFKTYLNTGSVSRGLSNGHLSLEPGLLAQYEWSPSRYWFGELRYWFPMGADPDHAGNVLRYSLGTSKLMYETDTFAAIRTFELVGTSVLSGLKTLPNGMTRARVDGEHSMAILPGFRLVLGPAGDLGLVEFGMQAGIATNRKGFYTSMGRMELRFNF